AFVNAWVFHRPAKMDIPDVAARIVECDDFAALRILRQAKRPCIGVALMARECEVLDRRDALFRSRHDVIDGERANLILLRQMAIFTAIRGSLNHLHSHSWRNQAHGSTTRSGNARCNLSSATL